MEAALATIIVGAGITATVVLFGACTMQNREGANMTTALLLASNVQEAMADLSFNDPIHSRTYFGPEGSETLVAFNDVDDFDGLSLCPPIDSMRSQLAEMGQYTQVISVLPVYANRLSSNADDQNPELGRTTYTGVVRVTVKILYWPQPSVAAREVYRCSWLRVDD